MMPLLALVNSFWLKGFESQIRVAENPSVELLNHVSVLLMSGLMMVCGVES